MLTLTQLEALRPTFTEWTNAIKRARREYDQHPTASCAGVRRIDEQTVPCDRLARTGDTLCLGCRSEATKAANRMRRHRATKKESS